LATKKNVEAPQLELFAYTRQRVQVYFVPLSKLIY